MTKPKLQKDDELGGLKWLLLGAVLFYGLFSLFAWPFRLAVRHLPGRRAKLLAAQINHIRGVIPSAQQLVNVLGTGAHELNAKMDMKMRAIEIELDRLVATQGWPEDISSEDPWSIAMDLLEDAERLGVIDWKTSPKDLKKAIALLLRGRGVSFNWAFLRELERDKEWDSLKNENLLPIVAARLAADGHVLAHIDDGSDGYNFALCTPDEFSRIESLSSGGYAVRRFEKARSVS
jgi:hypothetical protein